MHTLILMTGSNIGDRMGHLMRADFFIATELGSICALSPIYETEAWGVSGQAAYLNRALKVDTLLSPADVLYKLKAYEQAQGRTQKGDMSPRTIDIDIIFYDDKVIDTTDLVIPHPRMKDRLFVLTPLLSIMPAGVDPRSGHDIQHLFQHCPDTLAVRKYL